jgi:predicted O-methyltransferase YrrM
VYPAHRLALKYLHYLLTAANGRGHGIHSPFLYDFTEKLLNAKDSPEIFGRIEALRAKLKRDETRIPVLDLGAGSVSDNNKSRRVCDIAKMAAKPPKYGRLLHRIATHYGAKKVLELGTSLGMSSAYMASAPCVQELLTLEGAPSILQTAEANFKMLGLSNIRTLCGDFDQTLAQALEMMTPDLVFFDGNHRYEPTMRYFNTCKELTGEDAIFVFDDIHWSREMEDAWGDIRRTPGVTCTIDLFFVGVVCFRPQFLEPLHISIRY